MSQSQCGRSSSQTGYPSPPWWAVTPPTSMIGHRPLLEWQVLADPRLSFDGRDRRFVSGITTPLGELSRSRGQVTYALLTLSPLGSQPVLLPAVSSLDLHA